jgi:hypothetical protein
VLRKEAIVGLFLPIWYAVYSGFFLMLTSEHKRIQQRVETYPFKNPPPREGKAKGSANLTKKM